MTLLTFNSKYVVASTTAKTTTLATLVDDTEAIQTFELAASKVVLVIYQANNVNGVAMPETGMQNAISVDDVDKANAWDANCSSTGAARNCVFWLGTLATGSHTIKGRFASNTSGSTATISNRVLLIYIFDGDEFQYVDDTTTRTAPNTTMIDDLSATVTFTPSATCKALVMYNCANSGATESTRGKKAAINVADTDYGQAEKSTDYANYANSVFTVHALSLSAVSTTVKGRFANAGAVATVTINRRQLAVLLLADSTLMDVITSTTQVSTTSNALVDDAQATISRTTTDTRELLVVAVGTKRHGTTSAYLGQCYGIKINANDRTNSRDSPNDNNYAESAATTYAEQLTAGSHTVQGRFSNNYLSQTAKIDARQVIALWFSTGAAPTPKDFSDVGAGSDAFVNPYRAMGFPDAGHGVESFVNPFRAMGFSDVGSGVDVFALLRELAFSDSGLGSDSFAKEILGAILKAFSDAGLGSDAFNIPFKAMRFSDAGLGSDVFIIPFKAVVFADAGIGADVFVIPFKTMSFSDVASGTDVFFLLRELAFSDLGSGADAFAKTILEIISKAFGDAGLGSDVFSAKHIHKVKLPFLIGMTLDGQLVWIFKQEYDVE